MSNLIGQILLNQYRVDAFVASGGMGAVYKVWDLQRNIPLAMKALHADLADDPSIFKRFEREAQALRKLQHPNIVPFYGLYQDKGQVFLLEEFVEGNSLQAILRARGGQPLPVDETIVYMKGLCAALYYAHNNNIIHCDVKPGNVLVNRRGKIFLAGFGIAKFVGATTTTTMGVMGTPSYMAPEQILGRNVSPATDIYALGVMLFEMLTGQRPFRGTESGSEIAGNTPSDRIRFAHLRLPPPDPRQINPNLHENLARVALYSLNKDPAKRFRSALDFFVALCEAAQTHPNRVSDETTIIGDFAPPSPSTPLQRTSNTPRSLPQTSRRSRKKGMPASQKGIIAALSMAAVLILGVAALTINAIMNPPASVGFSSPRPSPFDEVLLVLPSPTETLSPTATPPPSPTNTRISAPPTYTPFILPSNTSPPTNTPLPTDTDVPTPVPSPTSKPRVATAEPSTPHREYSPFHATILKRLSRTLAGANRRSLPKKSTMTACT